MADSAFMKAYREEFIAGFEFGESLLGASVTTQAQIKGNEAVFLLADTGGEETTTRGLNGDILYTTHNSTQVTATLTEHHGTDERTGFNIFASQGDTRRIMAEMVGKKILRKKDSIIIAELATGTNDIAFTTDAVTTVMKAIGALGNQEVDIEEEDNLFGLISPAFYAKLLAEPEFASADYVDVKPLAGPHRKYKRWAGINWIRHPRLPGNGTNSEKCFLYHRNAIGFAMNTAGVDFRADYEEKHDRSWARATMYGGGKLIQNKGVLVIANDGSGYVPT